MYDRETVRTTNALFFTSFGKFMMKQRSNSGNKVNWINYKTGVKSLYFRLEVDQRSARVCIDIQHKDEYIRELLFEQFLSLKTIFNTVTDNNWNWIESYENETGNTFSRIYAEIEEVNIYKKESWHPIFNFYKHSLLKLDEFWIEFKALFLQMQ